MKSILTYKQGDVLLELKATKSELHKLDGFELAAHFSESKEEVQSFNDYKYFHIWAAILIKHGKSVKKQTDDFISELIPLKDSFFNQKRRFESVLKRIITYHQSVRNYENDVYDFINSYSASSINQKANEITAISDVLEEVNRSFDRAYSLARMKIQNVSNSRMAMSGIILSIIAIFVAVTSVYLSANNKPQKTPVTQAETKQIHNKPIQPTPKSSAAYG